MLQVPNSTLYPLMSMLDLDTFCCQKRKTLPTTTLIWWERGFFTEKQIFYFVSTVLSKIIGYWYCFKKPSQFPQWYLNACWCTVCFKFRQFQVIKVTYINECLYSASKFGVFESYLKSLPNKTRKVFFTFLKTNSNIWITSKFISVCIWHENKANPGH